MSICRDQIPVLVNQIAASLSVRGIITLML